MPGRLSLYDDKAFKQEIQNIFTSYVDTLEQLEPNYNIPPTKNIPIFTNDGVYKYAHFGLIPTWANDRKNMNINARAETLYEKKSFREAFKSRRCLVPVNGFYEWKEEGKEKQPYFIHSTNENFFVFAGLYEEWFDNITSKMISSVALITTSPNDKIAQIHDRMPVILNKNDWKTWLTSSSLVEVNSLLKPANNKIISMYKVNKEVNSVGFNSPKCIEKKENIQDTLF